MTKKLQAFNNDTKLRDDLIAEIKWHYDQDKIIQRTYGKDGKYCAVGCAIQSLNNKCGLDLPNNDHEALAERLNIPATIPHLIDRIFEGQQQEEAPKFALAAFSAIKPGADLSLVTPKFMVWLLTDRTHGVIQYATEDGKKAIRQVANLYKRVIAGETVTDDEWDRAAEAAEAAAWAADARLAASWAARAAAWASWAARAAGDAARAAARAASAAAWAASYKRMAKKLVKLLGEA